MNVKNKRSDEWNKNKEFFLFFGMSGISKEIKNSRNIKNFSISEFQFF